ncbi:MAG: family 43 glycosylhydrolase [Actinomycetota bacterium]|nr:family 43 glycosylhydrolase [Actinomycetota bacterium]
MSHIDDMPKQRDTPGLDELADLTSAVSADTSAGTGRPSAPRPWRGRRRVLATLLTLLAAVGATVVLLVLPSGSTAAPVPTTAPLPPPPPAPATAPAGVVVKVDAPDPYVYVGRSRDYFYSAGFGYDISPHVQVIPFHDLRNLASDGPPSDAMPQLPAWSSGWIWSVDVSRSGGMYVMWFTSQANDVYMPNGVLAKCIGEAIASSPLGPFVPQPEPAICQQWGSLDPQTFTDSNGSRWLIWKADLNSDNLAHIPTTIWSQRLSSDGQTLVGSPTQIAVASQPWENKLIEAPQLVEHDGHYYLFFSGNASNNPASGIGAADCAGPRGPCIDSRTAPLISTNSQGPGPGEESTFTDGGALWMIYSPNAIFGTYIYRLVAVARIGFGASGPYIGQFAGAVPGH